MTIEQIKKETQYGDYTTLGKILGLPAATAKMRFLRGDEEARLALEKIIENRNKLIDEYKTNESV